MFCEYRTEFTGLDCTLPAQSDVYMYPVLSLHYCHRNVLCTFLLCCTTTSAVCYVCFVCIALLPVQGAMYFLFVFTPLASAGCHVCLVCAAVLPAQSAMYVLFVLHYCQRRVLCTSCLCLHYCQRRVLYTSCLCLHYCQCRVLCTSCLCLHYCQRRVLCTSCLCCTTASAVCCC